MLHEDTSGKTQDKTTRALKRAGRAMGAAAMCTALSGCPAPQVRPTPEPAPCPAGAVEAMADKLGMRVGNWGAASLDLTRSAGVYTIREGAASLELGFISPNRDVESTKLFGTFIIGQGLVYGRFTQARIKDGQPFPVCFDMWDDIKNVRGGVIRERGEGPDSARIYSTVRVYAVRSFD